jgi:hypothetical protein
MTGCMSQVSYRKVRQGTSYRAQAADAMLGAQDFETYDMLPATSSLK